MIVQACLNGGRSRDFHPLLPLAVDAIARDAVAAIAAGAAELHIHPRGSNGRESLHAVGETINAVRRVCPGTLIGVSTGAWIEADEQRTREAIRDWPQHLLPDYASVNMAENDAPMVMQLLRQRGIGVEVGLATVADAERYICLQDRNHVLRVLIELDFEQDFDAARKIAEGILRTLEHANARRSILLHGFDATVWPFVKLAHELRFSTRIGLEDGKHLPDGTIARDNAALVATAVEIFRSGQNIKRSVA